jgi:rhamnosyl/mannosyltransferase
MKILQVGKYYPPARGGMETHLEQLCDQLKEQVELKVVVANEDQEDRSEIINGVPVHRLRTVLNVLGAPICPALPKAIRNFDADIVHIHTPHPTALLAYLISDCRSALVCTYHSDIVRQRFLGALIGPVQDIVFRRAEAIIVSTPNLITGSPVLSRHRDRCVIIPFGLKSSLYERTNTNVIDNIRRQYGSPLILAVGRLVYYKGFEFLIRAIGKLPMAAMLLIIGEGPLRPTLEAEIAALGLSNRVRLIGNVVDTTPYYQACDLFVLSSVARSEAFGIVQLEAMACGKAIVNTKLDGSGVPFVSRDGESGLSVAPADVDALAAAVARLLSDNALRKRFGEAGRLRVQKEFTLQRMADRTISTYRRVIANQGHCTTHTSIRFS